MGGTGPKGNLVRRQSLRQRSSEKIRIPWTIYNGHSDNRHNQSTRNNCCLGQCNRRASLQCYRFVELFVQTSVKKILSRLHKNITERLEIFQRYFSIWQFITVWSDIRTDSTVDQVIAKFPDQSKNHLKPLCGLPVSPYFSALKIRWMKDNVPAVWKAVRDRRCKVGTMDTWVIWVSVSGRLKPRSRRGSEDRQTSHFTDLHLIFLKNLTGGKEGGLYITDVTNASRTMLMNIETLTWDPTLCRYFDIPMKLLPDIKSSSEIYGKVAVGPLRGITISGVIIWSTSTKANTPLATAG